MSILTAKEEDVTLASVVKELRREKEIFKKKDLGTTFHPQTDGQEEPIKENELLSALVNFDKGANEIDIYWGSSVCNYPMYNVDFGWGNPERALIPVPLKNSFILMDSKYGKGIETMITLEEQVMAEFDKDKVLLEFASPYPIV
ncbi:hypothetical protein HAX54_044752 [Datura stramonium]|uniref:Uncharacterized protein n=1 Tax=Datura stramonium TaxID=4076 RepID=A0ABS8WIU0_DATST|nr:hypothetical protein [Datura stramonium]